LYEGGIRVPTIIRWPGVTEAGSECNIPITGCDYMPTFLEAAGRPLEPERHVDGVSVVPLLRGDTIESRPLFWHYPHYGNQGGMPGGAIRDGRWKLIEWYEDGSIELYDLEKDPSETTNLAKSQAEVANRLHAQLKAWRDEVGAKMPAKNPRYKAE
jgi:arylsulfatase A-like enzyme